MALPVSSLVPYMRIMADDYDVSLQEYTDEDLINNLRVGITLMEASWNHGYTIEFNNGIYDSWRILKFRNGFRFSTVLKQLWE